jgi:hypothetical protein
MKKILLATLISVTALLSGCQSNKANLDHPVVADLYIVHGKFTNYDTFTDEKRREWPADYTIEQVLEDLTKGSEPTIIYQTEVQTEWNKTVKFEDVNFLETANWPIKNREWMSKVATTEGQVNTSLFKFKMTPKNTEDGRLAAEMTFTMEFLQGIDKVEDKDVYYTNTDRFSDAKDIFFVKGQYYVFSAMALKNKESLIFIYKLKNE